MTDIKQVSEIFEVSVEEARPILRFFGVTVEKSESKPTETGFTPKPKNLYDETEVRRLKEMRDGFKK